MIDLLFQSGMFGLLILLSAITGTVFIILSLKYLFLQKNGSKEKLTEFVNMIVRSGVLAAAIGFTGTIFGGYQAIKEILAASDISMRVVWEGVNVALSSTILGFELFIISAVIWFVFLLILLSINQ